MWKVLRIVDVAGRAEVVARDEDGVECPCALVRNPAPGGAVEYDGMTALAPVARREDGASALAPSSDNPVDSCRRELRAVGEYDHRRLGLGRQRIQPAAERRSGTLLPIGAADDLCVRLHVVRAEHDQQVVDGARPPHPVEYRPEQDPLLRRAEPRRGPGREHDSPDAQVQPLSVRQSAVTFAT